MKKINLLHILIHFIATWFFIFSFRSFSNLYNLKILKILHQNGTKNVLNNSEKYGIALQDIWDLISFTTISGLIGILSAFAISIIISIKYKRPKINSLIVLFLSFLSHRFEVFDKMYSLQIIFPSQYIDNLVVKFSATGLFFLSLGLLLFFLKIINARIQKQTIA